MQVTSNRRQQNSQQQIERPLNEQQRIDAVLALMVTRIGHSMDTERINQWHTDLSDYPLQGIEWAFDSWSRNARRLPALADIVQLLSTWKQDNEETESDPHAGTGYYIADALWLAKRVQKAGYYNDSMLDELDRARGGAPPCRQPGFSANR